MTSVNFYNAAFIFKTKPETQLLLVCSLTQRAAAMWWNQNKAAPALTGSPSARRTAE